MHLNRFNEITEALGRNVHQSSVRKYPTVKSTQTSKCFNFSTNIDIIKVKPVLETRDFVLFRIMMLIMVG